MPIIVRCLCCSSLLFLLLSSCQSGQSDRTEIITVFGRVTAPNKDTPIASALITSKNTPGECGTIGTACTNADGRFELLLADNVTPDALELSVSKGVFQYHVTIPVTPGEDTANIGTLALPVVPAPGGANMAVVTGQFDRIQDVLAKLGFAQLDPTTFQLQLGTEGFHLYDGDGSLVGLSYPHMDALFSDNDGNGAADIFNYRIVFINCNSSENNYHWLSDPILSVLRQYVTTGGNLYVSDLSYNIVETLFPARVDFFGSDAVAVVDKEYMDAAMVGAPSASVNATLNDTMLSAWMANVSCTGGACINANGVVTLNGLQNGWVVTHGFHAPGDGVVWVQAQVQWTDTAGRRFDGVKPMSLMFDSGAGTVLYTSYHVQEQGHSPQFSPQERLLQYLIFEM